jgi:hypothetical protein
VGSGTAIRQLATLTEQYGGGAAAAVYDTGNVLAAKYHPAGVTVLLVYGDATARVRRNLPGSFQLGPELHQLSLPGRLAAG